MCASKVQEDLTTTEKSTGPVERTVAPVHFGKRCRMCPYCDGRLKRLSNIHQTLTNRQDEHRYLVPACCVTQTETRRRLWEAGE